MEPLLLLRLLYSADYFLYPIIIWENWSLGENSGTKNKFRKSWTASVVMVCQRIYHWMINRVLPLVPHAPSIVRAATR